MRKFLIFTIALATAANLLSCKKDKGTGSTDPTTPVTYRFTDPVNISLQIGTNPISSTDLRVRQQVIGNNIYLAFAGSVWRTPIGSTTRTETGFNGISTQTLFVIDKNEQFIYILTPVTTGMQIIKGNLATRASVNLLSEPGITQLNYLKTVQLNCMKVDDAGNFYIASMANNGSIVKVSAGGQVTLIARDLINPGYFEIRNEILYVPVNSGPGGRIIKIDGNNTVTDLVTNLTGPTNLVIDNHGNFVVRNTTTVSGANYHRYDIYNPDGIIISNIKDAGGTSILSNIYENMPMYIDSYNNLYFYHADGVFSGGYTYNNPVGQKGIFKIALTKN